MARIKFDIVKAEKPVEKTIIKEKPSEPTVIKSKYVVLVKTLRRLEIGDYIVVWKAIEAIWLKSRMSNVKYSLKKHLLPGMVGKYEVHYLVLPKVEGQEPLYDIIVKRVS